MQLIHARILLEAKRQLHYTDAPVHTVATELGFQDAAYFTRFFSRRVGISPRVFRQRGPAGIAPREPEQALNENGRSLLTGRLCFIDEAG
jgi:AraC family transcriptional activator of pobA